MILLHPTRLFPGVSQDAEGPMKRGTAISLAVPESWKIGVCILVQKKGRAKPNEDITEENQTRVFPEGLFLRGQRRAVTEPAPEKPGCIWDGPAGERTVIYQESHHGQ